VRTTLAVARKDFADSRRALTLRVATALLVLTVAAVYLFFWGAQDIDGPRMEQGVGAVALLLQFFVGLVAIFVGYGAVVGERTTGSLKILLGLPPTRRDVLLGAFLGRTLVVAVSVLVSVLALSLLSLATYGTVPLAEFLIVLAVSLLVGAVWTGITVGISASSGSQTRVVAGCITVWLVFVVLWEVLLTLLYYVIEGGSPQFSGPDLVAEPSWLLALQRLNPVQAFGTVTTEVLGQTIPPALFRFVVGGQRGQYTIAERYHGQEGAAEAPFYLGPEFAVLVLLAWIVVPLALGYRRFRRADL